MIGSARVLVVEDDLDLRQLYGVALRVAGYDVLQAADGLQALRCLEEADPDVVILDLALPILSGHTILQDLADNSRLRPRVLVVTGSSDPVPYVSAPRVFRKPFSPEALVIAVEECLRPNVPA